MINFRTLFSVSVLLAAISCVNEEYDLEKEINTDIQILENISMPVGDVAKITIDKILSYMESALMIETRGIYYYFLAYIKHDYFKRKFLNVTPNYAQHLQQAEQAGVSQHDIAQLFAILGTQRPAGL